MRTASAICGAIILTVLPVDGGEPLKLTVTPAQSFAPATVLVRARIEPSVENRALAIVANGDEFYRSSEIQLNGDQAPKTVDLRFSDLPRGQYEVYAVLMDASGHRRAIVRRSAWVMSTSGDR
jgi:hypothetical protein